MAAATPIHVSPEGIATLPVGITVTASPFLIQNKGGQPVDVIVNGGTVSVIAISRDNTTFYTTGLTAGVFHLSSGDYLQVTYSGAPTMTAIHR